MTSRRVYSTAEVGRIRTAYREIFPTITDGLVRYWDIGASRERPWSFLTTNFHEADYDRMLALHADVEALQTRHFSKLEGKAGGELQQLCDDTGKALRQLALEKHRCGMSIGICPWTDHGLLQTYASEKKRVTVIVGHDWYPVVPPKQHPFDSPLRVSGLHALEEKKVQLYVEGAPRAIFDGSSVYLFVNLIPDYRPPGALVTGAWSKGGRWLEGFTALIEALSKRFNSIQMISWGVPAWTALRKHVLASESRLGIMQYAKAAQGEAVYFEAGDLRVRYLPLAHPSFGSNFRSEHHQQHVVSGYKALEVGRPGPEFPLIWGDGALRVASERGYLPTQRPVWPL